MLSLLFEYCIIISDILFEQINNPAHLRNNRHFFTSLRRVVIGRSEGRALGCEERRRWNTTASFLDASPRPNLSSFTCLVNNPI